MLTKQEYIYFMMKKEKRNMRIKLMKETHEKQEAQLKEMDKRVNEISANLTENYK